MRTYRTGTRSLSIAARDQLGERQTEALKVPGSIPGLVMHWFSLADERFLYIIYVCYYILYITYILHNILHNIHVVIIYIYIYMNNIHSKCRNRRPFDPGNGGV